MKTKEIREQIFSAEHMLGRCVMSLFKNCFWKESGSLTKMRLFRAAQVPK